MTFTFEKLELAFLITSDVLGTSKEVVLSEIKSIILTDEKPSVVIDLSSTSLQEKELRFISELTDIVSEFKGIVVVIGVKSPSLYEFGAAVCLPTFHEAKEAIFMNDLENQFLNEMGEA
ncbi:MAG: hypothetical protein ACI97P_002321 [Arcticibacterium sp.]|jgi:hypothetical protein